MLPLRLRVDDALVFVPHHSELGGHEALDTARELVLSVVRSHQVVPGLLDAVVRLPVEVESIDLVDCDLSLHTQHVFHKFVERH